jgi:hypothetical protein
VKPNHCSLLPSQLLKTSTNLGQQHTYAIIGTIYRYLTNCFQHIFINKNHWILVQMHASTLDLHYIIYDSNRPTTIKKLPNNTIQLLINIISIKHLLYSYANVMQKLNNFCELFTITYVTDVTFGLNPEKIIYNVSQMWSHLHHNINNKTIYPFPKYSHSNTW